MKIILCSTFVPFVKGGAINIVEWLETKLCERGHEVDKIFLPQRDDPDVVIRQCELFRKWQVPDSDLLISFRPQSHLINHNKKVVWFIHHMRAYYDLWDSEFRGFEDNRTNRKIRQQIREYDEEALGNAHLIFSNSKVTKARLLLYNNIDSVVLYPPLLQMSRNVSSATSNEIVYISRVEQHKRQHLLIEALNFTKSDVSIRIIGKAQDSSYSHHLHTEVKKKNLSSRVQFANKWYSEQEKNFHLRNSMGLAYFPLDEDSYGFPILEAARFGKPVLTCSDSGGTLELIEDGKTGYVCEPNPISIAARLDAMVENQVLSRNMTYELWSRILENGINWDYVIKQLLS